jgi:outer membrane protein, multidrug efflux system
MMKYLLSALLALTLVACSVGPDYTRPETAELPEFAYRDSTVLIDTTMIAAADTGWWQLFGDTVLSDLIHSALHENNDVRIAAARVEEFMGRYGVAKSDFFPKIDAGALGTRGQSALVDVPSRPTNNRFEVNVSAWWEIDLWGKIRRATEAAKADLLASEEARRGVVLSVTALVANSYIDLLELDKEFLIAQATAQSREQSLKLFEERKGKGDVSDLELSQIESQYWLAKARIPAIEQAIVQVENAICVLLGRNPGPIPRGRALDSLALPGVPEGLPSAVLERRPDVRQAEEQLRAANARIGVAKSYYFPSISLTGLFGVASGVLSDLFKGESQTWRVTGQVFQPIFHWGEISGNVQAAEAFQKQALYGYVNAVHQAFADAENVLSDRTRTEQQRDAQKNQVTALRTYERLARMRYSEGVTSYLEVLDAERSLFDTELSYAQTQAHLSKSVVNIYRAFAGGWLDWASAKAVLPSDPVERREPEKEKK